MRVDFYDVSFICSLFSNVYILSVNKYLFTLKLTNVRNILPLIRLTLTRHFLVLCTTIYDSATVCSCKITTFRVHGALSMVMLESLPQEAAVLPELARAGKAVAKQVKVEKLGVEG